MIYLAIALVLWGAFSALMHREVLEVRKAVVRDGVGIPATERPLLDSKYMRRVAVTRPLHVLVVFFAPVLWFLFVAVVMMLLLYLGFLKALTFMMKSLNAAFERLQRSDR